MALAACHRNRTRERLKAANLKLKNKQAQKVGRGKQTQNLIVNGDISYLPQAGNVNVI